MKALRFFFCYRSPVHMNCNIATRFFYFFLHSIRHVWRRKSHEWNEIQEQWWEFQRWKTDQRQGFVSSGRGISRNGRKYTWGFGEKLIELIKRSFRGFISWGFEKESPWWNSRTVIGIPEIEAGLEAGFCDFGKRNLWKWKEIIFFHKPRLCSLILYFSFISKTWYNLVM